MNLKTKMVVCTLPLEFRAKISLVCIIQTFVLFCAVLIHNINIWMIHTKISSNEICLILNWNPSISNSKEILKILFESLNNVLKLLVLIYFLSKLFRALLLWLKLSSNVCLKRSAKVTSQCWLSTQPLMYWINRHACFQFINKTANYDNPNEWKVRFLNEKEFLKTYRKLILMFAISVMTSVPSRFILLHFWTAL